jgi:hypothetical protein
MTHSSSELSTVHDTTQSSSESTTLFDATLSFFESATAHSIATVHDLTVGAEILSFDFNYV